MHIKGRYKLIRKHDCDFWNLTYFKPKKNRFFSYFKFSLISKLKWAMSKNFMKFKRYRSVLIRAFQNRLGSRSYISPFLNFMNQSFINFKRLNFYKIFLRRGIRYVTYLARKAYYYKRAYNNDLLLGTVSSYRLYKPFKRKPLEKKRLFFQRIILFYNNFDLIKLKRFSKLGRKGQFGGVNYFFLLLESRVDSIILRFNLALKFVLLRFIRSGKVLVNDNPITYPNYIVKKNSFVHFAQDTRVLIYKTLKERIKSKKFLVQPPFYFEINYRLLIILIVPKLIDPSFVPYPFLDSKSSFLAGLHTILWGW